MERKAGEREGSMGMTWPNVASFEDEVMGSQVREGREASTSYRKLHFVVICYGSNRKLLHLGHGDNMSRGNVEGGPGRLGREGRRALSRSQRS